MIPHFTQPEKTLDQILEDALSLIPIYSQEWTNYNQSDPGVTILQTLCAFHLLQQTTLEQISDSARLKLLELLGFRPGGAVPASAPLKLISAEDRARILRCTKFICGGLMFETAFPYIHTNIDLLGVYYVSRGKAPVDLLHIVGDSFENSFELFGDTDDDAALYLLLTLPPLPSSDLSIYASISFGSVRRNPIDAQSPPSFAEPLWELYTGLEWVSLQARDGTYGFLQSGIITLSLPDAEAQTYAGLPVESWCLRVRAPGRAFDLPPRLSFLAMDILPVRQQTTLVSRESFPCSGGDALEVVLENAIALGGMFSVFCREEAGNCWRLYEETSDPDARGRFFLSYTDPDGVTILWFHAARGYFPLSGEDAVRVVCRDASLPCKGTLGFAYGFDAQSFETGLHGLVSEQFELMVCIPDENGEACYIPSAPGERTSGALHYRLDAQSGVVTLTDNLFDSENLILITSCVTSLGSEGNLRGEEGLRLLRPVDGYLDFPLSAFVPVAAEGGSSALGLAELRRMFADDLSIPYSAVCVQDYEWLTRETPGLLIHKVKAVARPGGNMVDIVVKPHGKDPFPALSPLYQQLIRQRLDQSRLLATRVNLLSPVYVPIDIHGTISIRQHYQNSRDTIARFLSEELNHTSGSHDFGGVIRYGELCARLGQLECVEEINEFTLDAFSPYVTRDTDNDLHFSFNTLCYLRECALKIIPHVEMR